MNILKQLQASLQNYIARGNLEITQNLCVPVQGDIQERLSTYRQGYYLRLLEALKLNYSLLSAYLDKHEFAQIAQAYIEAYPPTHFSLNQFGKYFPEFLQECYKNRLEMTEIASFEWATVESLEMSEVRLLAKEDLQAIKQEDWPNLVFKLIPGIKLFNFQFNTMPICKALQHQNKIPKLKSYQKPQCWLVWQKHYEFHYCRFNIKEVAALEAMQAQQNFAQICEKLYDFLPEKKVIAYLAELLLRWLEWGLLAAM